MPCIYICIYMYVYLRDIFNSFETVDVVVVLSDSLHSLISVSTLCTSVAISGRCDGCIVCIVMNTCT